MAPPPAALAFVELVANSPAAPGGSRKGGRSSGARWGCPAHTPPPAGASQTGSAEQGDVVITFSGVVNGHPLTAKGL